MNINSLIFEIGELNSIDEIDLNELVDIASYSNKNEYEVVVFDEIEYRVFFETEIYENTLEVDYRISTEIFRVENIKKEIICYIGRNVENRYISCEECYEREYLDLREIKPIYKVVQEWRFADEHRRIKRSY